jgi:hypothetical protein
LFLTGYRGDFTGDGGSGEVVGLDNEQGEFEEHTMELSWNQRRGVS